jgi:hypothetical protein
VGIDKLDHRLAYSILPTGKIRRVDGKKVTSTMQRKLEKAVLSKLQTLESRSCDMGALVEQLRGDKPWRVGMDAALIGRLDEDRKAADSEPDHMVVVESVKAKRAASFNSVTDSQRLVEVWQSRFADDQAHAGEREAAKNRAAKQYDKGAVMKGLLPLLKKAAAAVESEFKRFKHAWPRHSGVTYKVKVRKGETQFDGYPKYSVSLQVRGSQYPNDSHGSELLYLALDLEPDSIAINYKKDDAGVGISSIVRMHSTPRIGLGKGGGHVSWKLTSDELKSGEAGKIAKSILKKIKALDAKYEKAKGRSGWDR